MVGQGVETILEVVMVVNLVVDRQVYSMAPDRERHYRRIQPPGVELVLYDKFCLWLAY